MSKALNKIVLRGTISDINSKYLEKKVLGAKIIVDESYDWQGKHTEKISTFPLSFFGKDAEAASRDLSEGDLVYIEGKLKAKNYQKDGVERSFTSVSVENYFVIRKNQQQKSSVPDLQQADPNEDIPF